MSPPVALVGLSRLPASMETVRRTLHSAERVQSSLLLTCRAITSGSRLRGSNSTGRQNCCRWRRPLNLFLTLLAVALVRYQGDSISPTSCPNPIDCADFFVRQHYRDFLNREPEPAGLNGWLNILNNCGVTVPQPCDRIEVSSAFFRSPSFRDVVTSSIASIQPLEKVPIYSDWVPDFAKVSGFLTDQQLEAAKAAFVIDFMARPEFQSRYASTFSNPTAYVDALLQTVGLPNHPSRQSWINSLAG